MHSITAINIGAVLILVAILFFSRKPVRSVDPAAAIGWEAGLRMATAAWAILFLSLILPRFHAVFAGFGVELPAITRLLLKSAEFPSANCLFIMVGIPVVIAAEVVLFATLRPTEDQAATANRISIATTLVVVVGLALVAIALFLPLIKLLNDLS